MENLFFAYGSCFGPHFKQHAHVLYSIRLRLIRWNGCENKATDWKFGLGDKQGQLHRAGAWERGIRVGNILARLSWDSSDPRDS